MLNFLQDIEKIIYEELSSELERIRKHCYAFNEKYKKEIRSGDPILNKISLFGTMDYGRLETAHTRTLAWLLNPEKEHGFGNKLMNVFFKLIEPNTIFDVTEVIPEKTFSNYINNKGRFDIWITGKYRNNSSRALIVVEAKIDANEGKSQLGGYEKELKNYKEFKKIYKVFLTPEGRHAKSSASNTWYNISFLDLVIAFNKVIKKESDDLPGYHFLKYYLSGIIHDVLRLEVTNNNPYMLQKYLYEFYSED
jgi:hypothetical protein